MVVHGHWAGPKMVSLLLRGGTIVELEAMRYSVAQW